MPEWKCIYGTDGYEANFVYSIVGQKYETVDKYYNRIGAYNFTKKEKKKIEVISECNRNIFANVIKPNNHMAQDVSNEIVDKINELVDAVNKLMGREDEA